MVVDAGFRMDEERLEELLDRYTASLLVAGGHERDQCFEQEAADSPALLGLLSLVRALVRVFVPVRPSHRYVERLRRDLARRHRRQSDGAARWERLTIQVTRLSALLGAVVSVVALLALLVRVVGSIVMLITLLTRRRRAGEAAA